MNHKKLRLKIIKKLHQGILKKDNFVVVECLSERTTKIRYVGQIVSKKKKDITCKYTRETTE